ncbi:MAG: VWA domain-containing protein [Planctomycetes bacterium]|nr:VWA domain-containing protein [Planctomycetota bacterium]
MSAGFELLRPWATPLLLVAAALGVLGVVSLAWRARSRARLVSERHLRRFLPDFSMGRARVKVILAMLGAVGMGLALLGPVRGYTLREVQRRGVDLVLCLDTSRSMWVQDLKPDRLSRAQREMRGLLELLEGDRVGVIAFSGDARLVAPLTHDRTTLTHFIETLSPEDNMRGGTHVGGALDRALELFDGRTGSHEAICLLTDGEDLEGGGLQAAELAAERGIRVYVVGMGTSDGGKIPLGGGFVRDETGQEVVSALNGETLRAIADATGGEYLSAETSPFPLEELYEKRISRLDSRDLWAGKVRVPHDRYQWPLVIALACMITGFGMREQRKRSGGSSQ